MELCPINYSLFFRGSAPKPRAYRRAADAALFESRSCETQIMTIMKEHSFRVLFFYLPIWEKCLLLRKASFMQSNRYFLLVILTLLLAGCSVSRDIKVADQRFGYGEYTEAAKLYGQVYRRIPSSDKPLRAEVSFKQGECCRLSNQSVKAENAYMKAIRFKYPSDTVYLNYALTLHKNGKYKPAITNYQRFLDSFPENVQARNGLEACMQVEAWKSKAKMYNVKKSAVFNLKRGNYCPILIPSEYQTIIFTSSALLKENAKPSKVTGLPDNDFYMSKLDQFGKWEKPVLIEGAICSEFDEGGGSFDTDGKEFYFTRCVTVAGEEGATARPSIYKSTRSGDQWSDPTEIVISKDSSLYFAHPALSPDGMYLYFVSELPGGEGGKDIWRAEIAGGTVGAPVNLGKEINTSGDEMFPVFNSEGDLFFSSNGLPGLGGLDIFKAIYNKEDSVWQVENLIGLNSSGDDFGITFFGKEDRGFFSSNRKEAKGIDKIYEFGEASRMSQVSGVVTDRNGEPVPEATVRIVSDNGTNTKLQVKKDGTYEYQVEKGADYVMLGTCRGYLNYSNRFYSLDKDTAYIMDFVLTSLHLPVRIENIFFEFDKWNLMPESKPALDELYKLLMDNPHVTIEISAHTDRKGTDEYNERLSGKRAQSVVDYLIDMGIEPDRLTAHGYAKTRPTKVTPAMAEKYRFLKEGDVLDEPFVEKLNEKQQETADQLNRRCEFKVLKTTYKLF